MSKIKSREALPNNRRTADHIIPLGKFGMNTFYNVVAVCNKCNQKKADNFISPTQVINLIRTKRLMAFSIMKC